MKSLFFLSKVNFSFITFFGNSIPAGFDGTELYLIVHAIYIFAILEDFEGVSAEIWY